MDNKRGVKILIISFLFLVGAAYFVYSEFDASSSSVTISKLGTQETTDTYSPTTIAKNGTTVTYNFTIAHTVGSNGENVSNILVQLPAAGIFYNYWQFNSSNLTLYRFSENSSDPNWSLSQGAWNFGITDNNTVNFSVSYEWGGLNSSTTSVNVWVNATANASAPSDEIKAAWNITLVYTDGSINVTKLNTTIDNLAPRFNSTDSVIFYDLNITDGNHTWSLGNINQSYHLDASSDWNVSVYINDTNLNTTEVYLYVSNTTNATRASQKITLSLTGGSATPYLLSGTIPKENLISGNITSFFFVANDTVDHEAYGNNTWTSAASQSFIINSSTDVIKFGTMNVTDGDNTRDEETMRNGTKAFVRGNNDITIRLELSGEQKNNTFNVTAGGISPVKLYYNASRPANETDAFIFMTNESALGNGGTIAKVVYNVTFTNSGPTGDWNDTTVHLLVVANDTQGYTTKTIAHNFTADSTAPSATVSTSKTSITSGSSIDLTCSGSDNLDPTLTYTITYSIGSSESTESGSSVTISPTTIGTYTVNCEATDSTQHPGTSSDVTFTVTSASTSAGVSAGGTGSGATTTIHKGEEGELGELATETEEGVVEASKSVLVFEGSTASFTVSAGTGHKLVVDDIDLVNKKITVTISSDPVTLEIAMGESQKADLDGDGIYDVEVKLNDLDLILGRADITITDLVAIGVEEEVPPAEEGAPPEEVVPPGEVERVGLTGLWIVLVIIVIGLVVWWLLKKRK